MAYHAFPFLSIDAAGLLVPTLALGLSVAWAIRHLGRSGRTVFLALLTLVFLDLQFDPELRLPLWVVGIIALLAVAILHEHYTKIVTLSLLAMLAGLPLSSNLSVTVLRSHPTVHAADSALTPIVHIVLDEHAAPRAFPSDLPEAVQARERVLEFYRLHGFRLYANAYSQYLWSHSSIPATLSRVAASNLDSVVERVDDLHFRVRTNELFNWASGRGYRIHVVQGNYLDICGQFPEQVTSCHTYPSNSLRNLQLLRMPPHQRILLEHAYYYSIESSLVKQLRRLRLRRLRAARTEQTAATEAWMPERSGAGGALEALSALRRQVVSDPSNALVFGHIGLPHSPYELDGMCNGLADPEERLAAGWIAGRWGNTAESRRVRWRLYAGQTECLYNHLEAFLAAVDSTPALRRAVIVIHGDHGSRIVRTMPMPDAVSSLIDEDLLDGFAALLAVRHPEIQQGIDTTLVSVQDFVLSVIMNEAVPGAVRSRPVVYLEDYGRRGKAPIALEAPALAP
jgi:hypothetical protein